MDKELQEAKRKYMIRKLKKCGKCKFNNYVMSEKGYTYMLEKYCHVKEKEVIKIFFCRDFKRNR